MNSYRLDELEKIALELGVETQRVDENRLDVRLNQDAVLTFCNSVDQEDSLVGFDGTPWHSHGSVLFMTGVNTYITCDEFDILIGLGSGELVIVSRYLQGETVDRWLAHKKEPLDLRYIEPGEELRIFCLNTVDEARPAHPVLY